MTSVTRGATMALRRSSFARSAKTVAPSFARQCGGRIGDRGPKFLDDLGVGCLAGFDELVGEGVCIKHCKPHFAEHGGNGAFAAWRCRR